MARATRVRCRRAQPGYIYIVRGQWPFRRHAFTVPATLEAIAEVVPDYDTAKAVYTLFHSLA